MVAALKFFLGQDEAADNESDDEGDDEDIKAVQPSKQEMYNANKKVSTRCSIACWVVQVEACTSCECQNADLCLEICMAHAHNAYLHTQAYSTLHDSMGKLRPVTVASVLLSLHSA